MAEIRRSEQKLWLILFQIKAIRTRLNLLKIQDWLFTTLAILVGAGVVVFLTAVLLRPLTFLVVGALLLFFVVAGLTRVARRSLRSHANPRRAATIADDRAALKGRLATVLAMAEGKPRSSLWPYLVEDTYNLRHQYEPSTIEPRWISRALIPLAAACLLAAILPFLLRLGARHFGPTVRGAPAEVVADLGNLEVTAADPAQQPNAIISADPATLRQLRKKLEEASKAQSNDGGLSRWMDKARNLAGDLQDQVTGRKALKLPPLNLHLKSSPADAQTANGDQAAGSGRSKLKGSQQSPTGGAHSQNPGNGQAPPLTIPGDQADQLARNYGEPPSTAESNQSNGGNPGQPPNSGNSFVEGAGSSHGSGTDPGNLFGPPSPEMLGSDTFKLTVEAEPSDESTVRGAPAYIPPKVQVPLNSTQYPDEPLARTTVPAEDRMTIKRVFER